VINFYVDFAPHMTHLAIVSYDSLNPREFGCPNIMEFLKIFHETFLFLERHAIGTIDPSYLISMQMVVVRDVGLNPERPYTLAIILYPIVCLQN